MRLIIAIAIAAMFASPAQAKTLEPVIDVHMHALGANDQGPPPMAMCTPFNEFPAWDQRTNYADIFMDRFKHPKCKDPVWSPITDQALMHDTIAVMKRGTSTAYSPERPSAWLRGARRRRDASGLASPGVLATTFHLARSNSCTRMVHSTCSANGARNMKVSIQTIHALSHTGHWLSD